MNRPTAAEIVAFERDIADEFNAGKIRAPIHLDGGNEDALVEVFKGIDPIDWIFCSWRSHAKALLHGVPADQVKMKIVAGQSIALCFPDYHFMSSAIVGGHLPIALGVALSIKRRSGLERVHAFVGDMCARTGIFHECLSYAVGHALPICFVIEDNSLSVCTSTREVWGEQSSGNPHVKRFTYKLPWPHSGAGTRVQF